MLLQIMEEVTLRCEGPGGLPQCDHCDDIQYRHIDKQTALALRSGAMKSRRNVFPTRTCVRS
jgi:hypothetical protein